MPPVNPNPAHPAHRVRRPNAFTKANVLGVLVTIAATLMLVLPPLLRSQVKAARIKCINNVKSLGLGLRIFAVDNTNAWPWQVSTNHGGSTAPESATSFSAMEAFNR